ncbi:uncharacterized protein BDW43DRAFT_314660 [Aspergillus alliaceus]|uniref:uncharacterized protein n=1 Tax=Petromyces alliaceus TaxID=209559 RepID=UPI0012A514F9|nr:uncharacterized protein BDW43DRAFT_314660 [Aspergillus alliaceus]KAB8229804.1 hypothetical protein BDW43DRAFT_314660 [Aspergillus alliaceus]
MPHFQRLGGIGLRIARCKGWPEVDLGIDSLHQSESAVTQVIKTSELHPIFHKKSIRSAQRTLDVEFEKYDNFKPPQQGQPAVELTAKGLGSVILTIRLLAEILNKAPEEVKDLFRLACKTAASKRPFRLWGSSANSWRNRPAQSQVNKLTP